MMKTQKSHGLERFSSLCKGLFGKTNSQEFYVKGFYVKLAKLFYRAPLVATSGIYVLIIKFAITKTYSNRR